MLIQFLLIAQVKVSHLELVTLYDRCCADAIPVRVSRTAHIVRQSGRSTRLS